MAKTSTPAKITRPDPAASFPRARLFRWLDKAHSKRAVWIMGPPGCGKTTLVADYLARQRRLTLWVEADGGDSDVATFFHFLSLAAHKALPRRKRPFLPCTPERLQNLAQYARDYFRDLYAGFTNTFVLVVDNVHDLASDSPTLDILRLAVETLPDNGQLMFLSRTEPPAGFARARLNGQLALLDDNALRLTLDEAQGLAKQLLGGHVNRARITALHELTHGWAAGLVLLLEQTELPSPATAASIKTPGVLFEYFASEVFNKADADTRNVLLKSVFLPSMTARQAATLSGERRAGRILNHLSRHHFFTIRYDLAEPVFQYHPLFREFLHSRAQRLLDARTLRTLRLRAAALLEAAGQAEAALTLHAEAGDWEGYGRCLGAQASRLLDEGRHESLEHWLARLPVETLARSPWLLYWDACARLTRRPQEGRERFEQAMTAFAAAGEVHGARLAWCNIVSSIIHEGARFGALAGWIERFATLPVPGDGRASTDAPVTASMLGALALTAPQHPDTAVWAEHAQNLLSSRADTNKRLGAGIHLLYYYLYRGEMVRAASVANRLQEALRAQSASPLMQLLTLIASSFHDWLAGQTESALATTQQALNQAERCGIHLWDSYIMGHAAAAALSDNNMEAARLWLDRMAQQLGNARPLDAAFWHSLELWRTMLAGDLPSAREQLAVVGRHERELGLWFGALALNQAAAQIELAAGKPDTAQEPVRELLAGARTHGSLRYQFIGLLLEAQLAFDQHRDAEGLASLARAFGLGREQRLMNFLGFLPRVMARLSARALEAGIETEYARALIEARRLPVTDEARDLETWPWPVRIHTFGRLSIVSQDKPLRFSGRAQSRPLELLTALIAAGGRGVPEEQLSEQLWPDAEGDAAHRAFEITLHRLRKLLGEDEALILSDSKLSLNPATCWVDVWTLERLLGRLDTALRDNSAAGEPALLRLSNRLVSLYRGPFLGSGTATAWIVATRERLHSKFLVQLNTLAQRWEAQGHWAEASVLYQKAIDLQGHSEEYYQRLMQTYLKMQRPSEALAVYRRARETLISSVGRQPSAGLESFLQKINSALERQP